MKNWIKSMCLVLCGMMISATFIACGSDDDNNNDNNSVDSRVVGTWTTTIGEGWNWDENGVLLNHWKDLSATTTRNYEIINGSETGRYTDYTNNVPEWTTITFNADGSYIGENDEESFKGTFTAKDGVMTIFAADGADRWNYSFEDGKLKLVAEEYEDGVLVDKEINWYVKGLYQAGM